MKENKETQTFNTDNFEHYPGFGYSNYCGIGDGFSRGNGDEVFTGVGEEDLDYVEIFEP